jgi:hypothetical protein
LPGLNVICKMMADPASVPKVGYLDRNDLHSRHGGIIGNNGWSWRSGAFIEGNAGNILRKNIAIIGLAGNADC